MEGHGASGPAVYKVGDVITISLEWRNWWQRHGQWPRSKQKPKDQIVKTKPKSMKKNTGPAVEMAVNGMSDSKADAQERKWRAEDALRTLSDAERIKKDKALMGDAEKARKAKLRDLENIKIEVAPKTIK